MSYDVSMEISHEVRNVTYNNRRLLDYAFNTDDWKDVVRGESGQDIEQKVKSAYLRLEAGREFEHVRSLEPENGWAGYQIPWISLTNYGGRVLRTHMGRCVSHEQE